MTLLISSPILDNVAWFRLSTPDYGQFCTFSYISQNIMDNSVPFVSETFRSKEVGLSWCFGWVPKIWRKWEMMSTIFYPLTAGDKLDVYFHFLAFKSCFFCWFSFSFNPIQGGNLLRDKSICQGEDMPFKCIECKYTFVYAEQLEKHRTAHERTNKYDKFLSTSSGAINNDYKL